MVVSRIKVVHPPKVVNLESQEYLSGGLIKYGNKVITALLDPNDVLSLESARRIYELTFSKVTTFLPEVTSIRMIQLVINLVQVAYQYSFASWFLYLVTTSSGLRKLYECIFENPVYGILWYLSFYFCALKGTSDEAKFDKIASFLGLPQHSQFSFGQSFFETLGEKIKEKSSELVSMNPEGYKTVISTVLDKIPMILSIFTIQVGGVAVTKGKKALNLDDTKSLEKIIELALEKSSDTIEQHHYAVYISSRNLIDFDNREIQDQLKLIQDKSKLKRIVKASVRNPKDKRAKKQVLRTISELRTPQGGKVCLDECKVRVKTSGGGYCEGKCSTSTMWNDKHWCWVDPSKMKHGSTRDTFLGKTYDTCDPSKHSQDSVCFTGVSYDKCEVKK